MGYNDGLRQVAETLPIKAGKILVTGATGLIGSCCICVGQALYEKTRPECLLWAEVISIERKRSKTCENITDF